MSGIMYLAASGAILQQRKLEILSNNLANINTPGFKEDLPIFRVKKLSQESSPDNLQSNANTAQRQTISPYAPPFGIRTDFSPGSIKFTGNELDLALSGDGFFALQTEDGVRYTRQGNFRLNEEGILVSQDGHAVMGQGAEITIDGGPVSIGQDGTIQVNGEVVDQVRMVSISDFRQLEKTENAMFKPAEGFGPEIEEQAVNTSVNQGYIENSNVNAIRSMTDMIETLRVFEIYQKVIIASDEATSKVIKEVPGS